MSESANTRRLAALLPLVALCSASSLTGQQTARFHGLTPPGSRPVVFAPGTVSTDAYEFAFTITPDMKEMYVSRRIDPGPNRIVLVHAGGGQIREAVPAPFSKAGGEYEACVAPDGRRIFFEQDGLIVSSTRTREGWSEPRPLGREVNGAGAMAPWVDAAGNLYFTRRGGLVVARADGDGYHDAASVGPQFELPAGDAAHGFVAPDGSYIIFDSQMRKAGKGKADLYISFRTPGGSWTEPKNMEELNTPGTEMCASVSPDGRYLFFSRDGDIFWVDAGVIGKYR